MFFITAPDQPTLVEVTEPTISTLTVTWNAQDADSFTLIYWISVDNKDSVTGLNGPSHIITGLTADTTYTVHVVAVFDERSSATSETAEGTTASKL